MLDGYCTAFTQFLHTGRREALARHLDDGAEPAFLDVYRNGFLKTCTQVLRASYPAVAELIGEACFASLARRYVDAHPPRSASLVEYGGSFAAIVEETREIHGLAYLGCIARLDRAWTEVYFAADSGDDRGIAADALAALGEDAIARARGRLADCVRLLTLEFSALDAWARLRRGALRSPTPIASEPIEAIVWRRGDEIRFRALGAPEHALAAGIAAGKSCADAAADAVALDADFDVGAAFASLLAQRLLIVEIGSSHAGSHGGLR